MTVSGINIDAIQYLDLSTERKNTSTCLLTSLQFWADKVFQTLAQIEYSYGRNLIRWAENQRSMMTKLPTGESDILSETLSSLIDHTEKKANRSFTVYHAIEGRTAVKQCLLEYETYQYRGKIGRIIQKTKELIALQKSRETHLTRERQCFMESKLRLECRQRKLTDWQYHRGDYELIKDKLEVCDRESDRLFSKYMECVRHEKKNREDFAKKLQIINDSWETHQTARISMLVEKMHVVVGHLSNNIEEVDETRMLLRCKDRLEKADVSLVVTDLKRMFSRTYTSTVKQDVNKALTRVRRMNNLSKNRSHPLSGDPGNGTPRHDKTTINPEAPESGAVAIATQQELSSTKIFSNVTMETDDQCSTGDGVLMQKSPMPAGPMPSVDNIGNAWSSMKLETDVTTLINVINDSGTVVELRTSHHSPNNPFTRTLNTVGYDEIQEPERVTTFTGNKSPRASTSTPGGRKRSLKNTTSATRSAKSGVLAKSCIRQSKGPMSHRLKKRQCSAKDEHSVDKSGENIIAAQRTIEGRDVRNRIRKQSGFIHLPNTKSRTVDFQDRAIVDKTSSRGTTIPESVPIMKLVRLRALNHRLIRCYSASRKKDKGIGSEYMLRGVSCFLEEKVMPNLMIKDQFSKNIKYLPNG